MTTSAPLTPASGPRKRPPPRVVAVRRVARLTPRMVRITFGGEQLEGFDSRGPAEHFRIYLPDSETGELVLPTMGLEGNAFPENRPRPESRAYTPRRWDPAKVELDVDIALHEHGPGAAWAAGVKEGDIAVISGQAGGAYFPEANADWYVIGGDEAALPAICTVLEALPAGMPADVLIEVHDAHEEIELASPAALQARWLHRAPGVMPGRMLAGAMCGIDLLPGDGRIWVSCEASVMREIRRHFIEDREIDRSKLRTQGYWKVGAVNHPDHDMGEDV